MTKEKIIQALWDKYKLIRVENNYTQEEMAEILGISKKTLVQIEKGRVSPGWTTTVALCALFRNSELLQNALGGDPLELLEIVGHSKSLGPMNTTLGGRIWWVDIHNEENFRIQQNIISRHYRLLDNKDRRWISSFDLKEIEIVLKKLLQQRKD